MEGETAPEPGLERRVERLEKAMERVMDTFDAVLGALRVLADERCPHCGKPLRRT
jgi:hypothetical protein